MAPVESWYAIPMMLQTCGVRCEHAHCVGTDAKRNQMLTMSPYSPRKRKPTVSARTHTAPSRGTVRFIGEVGASRKEGSAHQR